MEVGHPSWNSRNKKAAGSDETSTSSPSNSSFGRPTSESGEMKSPKIMTLDDFIKEKASKRNCNTEFQTKKTKKAKANEKTKVQPDVTINIGLKRFVNGEIKTVWGKRLPISVCRNATYAHILQKGVEKWKMFDRNFNSEEKYVLLYEDGSCAQFMPGSFKYFFELEKYKTELGKEFKRITLYLCTSNDLESSQESENVCDDTTDQDFCEEEISSHVHGDRHIPIDEAEQIESDMKLAQLIQCEWDGDNITETDPKSTEDIFKGLVAKVNDEKEFLIATRRKADLTRKLYLWQRQTKKNSPTSTLRVHYIGEDGVDSGAIRKEFLESTLQDIKRVMFPCGTAVHSTFHVQNGNFRTCGEIVATSIAQGGPSPCFLEPCAFDASWKQIDVLNISDGDLTKEEHEILDAVTADCTAHTDIIIENGYSGKITESHIEEIVNSLKVSFVNRRYLYMNEFKIGLNAYGLGDLISSYPDICKPFLLQEFHAETVPDGDYLFSLLKPKYSPESTTRRVLEESMMDHLQDLLISFEDREIPSKAAVTAWNADDDNDDDLKGVDVEASQSISGTAEETLAEADLTVAGIMGWLTGQKHKPMFDEKPAITVHFDHECLQRNPLHTVCFPMIGACGRDLTLPVAHMKSKEEFRNIFVAAVCNGQEFAKP